jgi:biopolymer transport protein ExbD
MPRRSFSRQATQIELFPFLSVLACTIGTLILLIIVLTTNLFDAQKEVTILAKADREQGQNKNKTPRYIECRGNGIVIYPEQQFVAKNDLDKSNAFLMQLLSQMKQRRDREYIIVTIRPDGVETFQKVRLLVEAQQIAIGYEPIEEDWKLKVEK